MKRIILGLMVAVLAGVVHSATWFDIAYVPGKSVTQIDADSLAQIGPGQYNLTWRVDAGPEKISEIYTGTVYCSSESIRLNSKRVIEQNSSLVRDLKVIAGKSGNIDSVYDYEAGTVTWIDVRPRPLSALEKSSRYQYPSNGGEAGSLLQHLCAGTIPSTAQREAVSSAIQAKLGCNAAPWKGTVLCQRDPKSLGVLYSLTMRFEQATSACSLPTDQTNEVLRDWYQSLAGCRDAGGCVPVMQLKISGLTDDLVAASEQQSCTYLAQSVTHAKEHGATRMAMANFRTCVTKQIPALDDGMSSADVIANATYGACEGLLPARMIGNSSIRGNILPGISAEVLQFRQLLLKRQKPRQSSPKPKSYQG